MMSGGKRRDKGKVRAGKGEDERYSIRRMRGG